jgi:hypothetical protein
MIFVLILKNKMKKHPFLEKASCSKEDTRTISGLEGRAFRNDWKTEPVIHSIC